MLKNKSENNSSLSFMNLMVDTYNKGVIKRGKIVFELYFKDLDETYQLHMTSNGCLLKINDFLKYNTRLETKFKVFSEVLNGKIDNNNLVIRKKDHNVLGEFRTMSKLIDLFGLYSEADLANAPMMGMVSNYNTGVLEDEEIILELYFKDLDKTYQVHMYPNDCVLRTNNFSKYTTRVETTFKTWLAICKGELGTREALILRKYKVLGDYQTMFKLLDVYDILNEK